MCRMKQINLYICHIFCLGWYFCLMFLIILIWYSSALGWNDDLNCFCFLWEKVIGWEKSCKINQKIHVQEMKEALSCIWLWIHVHVNMVWIWKLSIMLRRVCFEFLMLITLIQNDFVFQTKDDRLLCYVCSSV